jgi:hypothetical protein
MAIAAAYDHSALSVTNGAIAALNLESARQSAWARFARDPRAPGVAEAIVDMERLKLQFIGDVDALGRLETLASQLAQAEASFRTALVRADAASTVHCFAEARDHLARASAMDAPREDIERRLLAINQACGVALDTVLAARRKAAASGRLEDLIPLGAVLADLELFAEAGAVYQKAIFAYDGTSPFPLAWAAFQLGMLWGELAPNPNPDLAACWYTRALAYVPAYTKARVHLAEIRAAKGQAADAEALLLPALATGDPEVSWRLADTLCAQGRRREAEIQLDVARHGFGALLAKYPLAFADHAAEFYAGSGNELGRSLQLAHLNVANRPTRRAIEQAEAIAAALQNDA